MSSSAVLPIAAGLQLERTVATSDHIELVLAPSSFTSACPLCATASGRIQSRYSRSLADMPIQGVPVRVRLSVRRFFCPNQACLRKVFCERLPDFAPTHARFTRSLTSALRTIGLALGGEAGSRLAIKLGMPAAGDTILRRVRAAVPPTQAHAPIIGIDDWAIRRGQNYGTIVVDLEHRRPIDLMPGRDATTVATWLKQHPGVEVVARDRWGAYAEGIRQGAPTAIQIADRFHLVKNAREVLEHMLHRRRKVLREATRVIAGLPAEGDPTVEGDQGEPPMMRVPYSRGRRDLERSEAFNAERQQRYDAVQTLKREGYAVPEIARRLGMSKPAVRRMCLADTYPAIVRPKRGTLADRFDEYLRQRWLAGEHNVEQLFRELKERGYTGSSLTLRRYTTRWRECAPVAVRASTPKSAPTPAPRTTSWLLLAAEAKLQPNQQEFIDELQRQSPEIATAVTLVKEFRDVIVSRKVSELDDWFDRAVASGVRELRSFVASLRKDMEAVRAAATHKWSTGQVEGQIHRLKLLKRQMYGRAKIDLLRIRLLEAA